MSLGRVAPGTVALLLGGVFLLLTGSYTDNGGFQFAGAILLVVGILVAFSQARDRSGDGS